MPAPTGFTLITAAKIQNASGKLLASGRVSFFPVNSAGRGLSALAGGGGMMSQTAVTFLVVNGAITTDLYGAVAQLADTTLTNPVNIGYRVTVTDSTGYEIQGPGYELVQPSGPTWSLDTAVPSQPLLVTTSIVAGTGSSTRPSTLAITDTVTSNLSVLLFVNGTRELIGLGSSSGTAAAIVFVDTTNSASHYKLTTANGALTLTSVSIGVAGVAGYPMIDTVSGANVTLQVTGGSLTQVAA
jgi:hypothetical protein